MFFFSHLSQVKKYNANVCGPHDNSLIHAWKYVSNPLMCNHMRLRSCLRILMYATRFSDIWWSLFTFLDKATALIHSFGPFCGHRSRSQKLPLRAHWFGMPWKRCVPKVWFEIQGGLFFIWVRSCQECRFYLGGINGFRSHSFRGDFITLERASSSVSMSSIVIFGLIQIDIICIIYI